MVGSVVCSFANSLPWHGSDGAIINVVAVRRGRRSSNMFANIYRGEACTLPAASIYIGPTSGGEIRRSRKNVRADYVVVVGVAAGDWRRFATYERILVVAVNGRVCWSVS